MKKHLKFGLILEDINLKKWQVDCVRSLINTKGVSITLVIKKKSSTTIHKDQTKWFSPRILKHSFHLMHLKLMKKPKLWRASSIKDLIENIDTIYCDPQKSGICSSFKDDDIDIIGSYNLDFILRFGFGILKGDILNLPSYGVWSFHHDDEQKYRGSPPCFWPIYTKDNHSGVILQKLNETLDGGIVLEKGLYKTIPHSYSKNIDLVYGSSIHFPSKVCRRILSDNNYLKTLKPANTLGQIYKLPTNLQMIIFFYGVAKEYIHYLFSAIFKTQFWHIGIINEPIQSLLDSENIDIKWLPKYKKNRFLADPFILKDDDKYHIFVEDYDFINAKGEISRFEYKPEMKSLSMNLVAKHDSHLSYPFVFKHKDLFYCLPESAALNKIILLKSKDLNSKWEKLTLIEDISAVDSTLFNFDNKWWLFCVDKKYGSSSLSIWFSDDLMGKWQEHPLNPVKNDVRGSRPAGNIFEVNGKFFRPAQNNEVTYGGSISIFEIKTLSEVNYEERLYREFFPDSNSDFPKGVHTISSCGGLTVIDGKNEKFVFDAIKNIIIQKFKYWFKY